MRMVSSEVSTGHTIVLSSDHTCRWDKGKVINIWGLNKSRIAPLHHRSAATTPVAGGGQRHPSVSSFVPLEDQLLYAAAVTPCAYTQRRGAI
jgi:hypothetical protein